MADIIDLSTRLKPGHNLIASAPLEFRRGEWLSGSAILCTREESAKLEAQRRKATHGQASCNACSKPLET